MTKIYEVTRCAKGGYVAIRNHNQTISNTYYPKVKDMTARIKELKKEGYTERAD